MCAIKIGKSTVFTLKEEYLCRKRWPMLTYMRTEWELAMIYVGQKRLLAYPLAASLFFPVIKLLIQTVAQNRFQELLRQNETRISGTVKVKKKISKHQYETLEARNMLTGITIEKIIGLSTLLIDGSNANDIAEVRIASNGHVEATLNGQTTQFSSDEFERIRFLGRSGDDSFTNHTNIDSAAFGHSGNDQLVGGNGHNWIQGGDGHDHIVGGDRNDQLRGRAGNDVIEAGKRHDRIFGGGGNDTITAGAGRDFIQGEGGNDQIYGGNGNDRINAGAGNNTIHFGNSNGADIAILDYDEAAATVSVSDQLLTISADSSSVEIANGEIARFVDIDRAIEDYFVVLDDVEQHSLELLNQLRSSRGTRVVAIED